MKYIHDSDGYQALFDQTSGIYIRNGNPFWRSEGPELLDISITNYCERGCEFCYRRSDRYGLTMSLEMYEYVISEAEKCGVSQVALGGGNPNQHPQFIEILRLTRDHGIVPSYTTNGQGMTEDIYRATSEYAGAVAVSWYDRGKDARKVVDHCRDYGIPANIHIILDDNNVRSVRSIINDIPLEKVNALIFLNYKPVTESKRTVLSFNEYVDDALRYLVCQHGCRIGFDSCMISHLTSMADLIDARSIDFCESGRFSAFVDESGLVYPCSFMCGAGYKGYDIRKYGLKEIWREADGFVSIRDRILNINKRCDGCISFEMCHGGCPVFDINC